MPIQNARLARVYIGEEASYGTAATLAATDAFRHIEVSHGANNNRSASLEKRATPGLRDRFNRHIEANFNIGRAYLQPSGVLGTVPEGDLVFLNGMGAKRVSTGTSTVAASPSPTTTTADVASATGFQIGDFVLINCTGGSFPGLYVRRLTNVVSTSLTWTPALPQAPVTTNTIKGGIGYTLANDLPASLTAARYFPDRAYQFNGWAIDRLGFKFNGNAEAELMASGPAKEKAASPQAEPGAFTTVGSPVTGLYGSVYVDGAAFLDLLTLDCEINNAMKLDNESFGTDRARAMYRQGRRDCTISLGRRMTDDDALYEAAADAADLSILIQSGLAEGGITGLWIPRFELDVPDTGDSDGDLTEDFRGVAKENTGNDEVSLFFC
jgi:hypothetical protein